jgi:23S rRNA (pseudouridine1915-N3)-methyltransferase
MRLAIIAVGQRQPRWAELALDDYAKRFPPELALELKAVKAEPRTGGKTAAQMMAAESQRLLAACPKGARRVALDEHGGALTTVQLSARLGQWQREGRDVCLLIGGPDGLAPELKAGADETLRLSDLTLPHALARVLLVETLYRAWSLAAGHPYHRQ